MRFAASGREPGMFTVRSSGQPLSLCNNCYKPVHGFSKGFPQVIHLAAPVILRLFHSEFPCFFRKNRFSPQKRRFIHRRGRTSSTGSVENSFYPQPKTYDGLSISLSSICNTSDVFAPYFLHKTAADRSYFSSCNLFYHMQKGLPAQPLCLSGIRRCRESSPAFRSFPSACLRSGCSGESGRPRAPWSARR